MDKKFWIGKINLLLPMAIFFVVYMCAFTLLEDRPIDSSFHLIQTKLDNEIPFVPVFIIPYLLWFPYMAFNIVYLALADEDVYRKTSWLLMFGMTVFIVVSFVFPNYLVLRPKTFDDTNIFTSLIAGLYKTDTPTNVCPSIHVYNSIVIMLGIASSKARLASNKIYLAFTLILGVLICISTMFCKQHSVIDVICAIILVVPAYIVLFRKKVGYRHAESAQ